MERSAIVVEDDANTALALTKAIRSLGYSVRVARTLKEARSLYQDDCPDLVLLDVSLPDGDGLDLMNEAPQDDGAQFVVVTGNSGQDVAVRSLRARASDFLVKPISLAELRDAVKEPSQIAAANDAFTTEQIDPGLFTDEALTTVPVDAQYRSDLLLSGKSDAVRELQRNVTQLAETQANIAICGAAGVDKIAAAYALHFSGSSPGSIVHVQCATGHVLMGGRPIMDGFSECLQMSFAGKPEQQRTTLILDDIDLLDKSRQNMLLGYLTPLSMLDTQAGISPRIVSIQRGSRFTKAGDNESADFGKLNPDLALRLYQSKLEIPTLKQRQQDIEPIARKMLALLNYTKKSRRVLSDESLSALEDYDWPGNLRELANVIADAFNKTTHDLNVEKAIKSPDNDEAIFRSLDAIVGKTFWEVEKFLLQATLQAHDGNKKLAAKTLGISLKTLYNRLNAYSIEY